MCGRLTEGSKYPPETDEDLNNTVWLPPLRSNASRTPARRGKGSVRGATPDLSENRVKVFESDRLERGLLSILMADRRVAHIQDQPKPVAYMTPAGRERTHTFDFLVTFRDGRRVAYAAKPLAKVESTGIETTLRLIRKQSLSGFADAAVLRTEKTVPKRGIYNARTILRARSNRNLEDVRVAFREAAKLNGWVRLGALVRATGMNARGRIAVLCLVDEGMLEPENGAWLGDETHLRFNPNAKLSI